MPPGPGERAVSSAHAAARGNITPIAATTHSTTEAPPEWAACAIGRVPRTALIAKRIKCFLVSSRRFVSAGLGADIGLEKYNEESSPTALSIIGRFEPV